MLRTHRAGKVPGEMVWGVRLRLNRTEGGQVCLLPLVSEGGGPHLVAQQASWAQVGGANALCSSPVPLVLEVPAHLPLLISPAYFLCPQDQRVPEVALESGGLSWDLSRLPEPEWVGQLPSAPLLLLLFWGTPPTCLS